MSSLVYLLILAIRLLSISLSPAFHEAPMAYSILLKLFYSLTHKPSARIDHGEQFGEWWSVAFA